MSFRSWWRKKSGGAKAVTVLATLLILQIGMCFASDAVAPQIYTIFHLPLGREQGEEYWGLPIAQAFLCLITLGLLVLAVLLWLTSSSSIDRALVSVVPKQAIEAEDDGRPESGSRKDSDD